MTARSSQGLRAVPVRCDYDVSAGYDLTSFKKTTTAAIVGSHRIVGTTETTRKCKNWHRRLIVQPSPVSSLSAFVPDTYPITTDLEHAFSKTKTIKNICICIHVNTEGQENVIGARKFLWKKTSLKPYAATARAPLIRGTFHSSAACSWFGIVNLTFYDSDAQWPRSPSAVTTERHNREQSRRPLRLLSLHVVNYEVFDLRIHP